MFPTPSEFNRGCLEYEKNEQRDSMYKVATFLMKHFWGSPADMADSLGVLLVTWNNAFYRYGPFSYDLLQACIEKNIGIMERFRSMKIIEYNQQHDSLIQELFETLRTALQISYGKRSGCTSPVSAAKALHLLAPEFFPIWDDKISKAYDCFYSGCRCNPLRRGAAFPHPRHAYHLIVNRSVLPLNVSLFIINF